MTSDRLSEFVSSNPTEERIGSSAVRSSVCMLRARMVYSAVPGLSCLQTKYEISRPIRQRTRAKLARLGLIEHVRHPDSRYGGWHGWKLSSRLEAALKQLARNGTLFREKGGSRRKDEVLLVFMEAGRG